MRLRTAFSLIIIAAFGVGMAACGGGSVSTGGGSGSSGTDGASSSIVVQAPRSASASDFQGRPQQARSLAAIFSDFLIRDAMAQAGVEVTLLDDEGNELETELTDPNGEVVFAVEPGDYIVCFGDFTDPTVDENCNQITVDEDVVVVLSLDEELQATVEVLRAEDDIVEDPESPGNANKVLVCHKDKFTISVAEPAARNGHMAHGDTMGPCSTDDSEETAETDTNNGGGNGNGNGNGEPS